MSGWVAAWFAVGGAVAALSLDRRVRADFLIGLGLVAAWPVVPLLLVPLWAWRRHRMPRPFGCMRCGARYRYWHRCAAARPGATEEER